MRLRLLGQESLGTRDPLSAHKLQQGNGLFALFLPHQLAAFHAKVIEHGLRGLRVLPFAGLKNQIRSTGLGRGTCGILLRFFTHAFQQPEQFLRVSLICGLEGTVGKRILAEVLRAIDVYLKHGKPPEQDKQQAVDKDFPYFHTLPAFLLTIHHHRSRQ